MIKNTFSILQGIGESLEKKLWSYGILFWEDFLAANSIAFINYHNKICYDQHLQLALKNLAARNVKYFSKFLKQRDHWRLYKEFRDSAVALDIETNGLPMGHGGCVTMVGLYNGFHYTPLIKGINLTKKRLEQELNQYNYIITFYGSVFDLPYLHNVYNLWLDLPHFDLCFCGRRTGLEGGLKKIEETLGIMRDETVKDFIGFDAVRLWNHAQKGNSQALELLITYNRCDTANLFLLADIIFERLVVQTGISSFLCQR